MKHETGKHNQVQASQGGRKPLVITHQPSEPRGPRKRAFHNPSPRQQDKAAFGLRQFDHFQLDAVLLGLSRRDVARIALVHKGEFDRLAGHLLHGLSKLAHLRTILLVSRSDQQSQQVAQRIDGRMYFAAFVPLGSIIARMATTFRRRLQGATIKDGCRGLPAATPGFAQEQAQIVNEGCKAACRQPALGLLIDDVPGWQIIGHHAPGGTCSRDPTQAIEDFAQAVGALSGVFG